MIAFAIWRNIVWVPSKKKLHHLFYEELLLDFKASHPIAPFTIFLLCPFQVWQLWGAKLSESWCNVKIYFDVFLFANFVSRFTLKPKVRRENPSNLVSEIETELPDDIEEIDTSEPSRTEVGKAIGQLKNGKAPEINSLHAELLKADIDCATT